MQSHCIASCSPQKKNLQITAVRDVAVWECATSVRNVAMRNGCDERQCERSTSVRSINVCSAVRNVDLCNDCEERTASKRVFN